jgi:hypothetical protein
MGTSRDRAHGAPRRGATAIVNPFSVQLHRSTDWRPSRRFTTALSPRRAVGWPMLRGPGQRHARGHGRDRRAGVLRAATGLFTRPQARLGNEVRDVSSSAPSWQTCGRSACPPPRRTRRCCRPPSERPGHRGGDLAPQLPVVDFRRRDARPGSSKRSKPRPRRHGRPLLPASARPRRRARVGCAHPRRRSQAMGPPCPSPGGVAR